MTVPPLSNTPTAAHVPDAPALAIEVENEDFAVIIKPSGLRSVPARGSDVDPALADSVETRTRTLFELDERTPVVVHRLDMDTSGLMVVAKHRKAHRALSRQFMDRKVGKTYTALVEGHLDLPTGDEGAVDLPLVIDWKHRPLQHVHFLLGRPARTLWRVVSRESLDGHDVTRVTFRPLTGRSHQLRVHAAAPPALRRPGAIEVTRVRDTRTGSDESVAPTLQGGLGAPIVGDTLYASEEVAAWLDRLALHAAHLAFWNPSGGGDWLKFDTPPDF